MDAEITKSFLAKLAEVFEVDANLVQMDFPLAERWDSVAVLTTIAAIDEHFDVTVPVDDLTACTSVAELLALVRRSLDQRVQAR